MLDQEAATGLTRIWPRAAPAQNSQTHDADTSR